MSSQHVQLSQGDCFHEAGVCSRKSLELNIIDLPHLSVYVVVDLN